MVFIFDIITANVFSSRTTQCYMVIEIYRSIKFHPCFRTIAFVDLRNDSCNCDLVSS